MKRAVIGFFSTTRHNAIAMKIVNAINALNLKNLIAWAGLLLPIEFPMTTVVAYWRPTATTNIYPLS